MWANDEFMPWVAASTSSSSVPCLPHRQGLTGVLCDCYFSSNGSTHSVCKLSYYSHYQWGRSQTITISSAKIPVLVESSWLQLSGFVLKSDFHCRVSDFSHLSIFRGRKTLLWQRFLTSKKKKRLHRGVGSKSAIFGVIFGIYLFTTYF